MKIYNKIIKKEIDIDDILKKYEISLSSEKLQLIYNNEKRYYHNMEHIESMIKNMVKYDELLIISILFHNVVFEIDRDDNEEKSYEFFDKYCNYSDKKFKEAIKKEILNSKQENISKNSIDNPFFKLKYNIFFTTDFTLLLNWEKNIFKEYQKIPTYIYKELIIDLLKKMYNIIENENLLFMVKIIENKEYKIGFYPGSFNPFHVGHYNILQKAEKMFDKVIIGFGKNIDKINNKKYEAPKTIANREIIEYDGLIISEINKLSKSGNIYLIRGLRNEYDLQYEENLRNAIKDFIPEQNFVYFFCDKEYEHISSGLIRDIMTRGDEINKEYFNKYCVF